MTRIFGEIEGYPEGSWFKTRLELSHAGLHRPPMHGISGNGDEGSDSIVLSAGYEDDEDLGDVIVYTGEGGRDLETKAQVRDQELTQRNLGLAKDQVTGNPVRVIRGPNRRSPHAPSGGYRYDGLYRVEEYWSERGKSGYLVWRFRLVKIQPEVSIGEEPQAYTAEVSQRYKYTILRIVRDTKISVQVKELYEYTCQVCGLQIQTPAGLYAEAAHIRPLGRPHNGPDTPDNLLCLCPNHHLMFDMHVFTINDDLTLNGIQGELQVLPNHSINFDHIRYHRERYQA